MARIATCVLVASMLAGGRARADDCVASVRGVELSAAWQSAVDDVRDALANRNDVDRCAEIVVEANQGGVRITVTLGDRHTAIRRVDDLLDLHTAVIALVLVPSAPPALDSEPLDVVKSEPAMQPPAMQPPAMQARFIIATQPGRIDHIDLGLDAGASWTADALGGSVSASARAASGRWLAGIEGRFGSNAAPPQSQITYTLRSLEIGADVGARIGVGAIAITATGGPAVAVLWQQLHATPDSTFVDVTNAKTGTVDHLQVSDYRTGTVVRLGGAVRAELPSSSRLALYVVARASFDVASDAANDIPMSLVRTPTLPTWSAGIAIGGEVRVWP